MYPAGRELESGGTVMEVREAPGEAVLMVRWERDPHLYGIPIALGDTSGDFYYTDYPVASTEEWLGSVSLGLMIHLDTGFRVRARRTQGEDYIELREAGGWPVDERFSYSVVEPCDPYSWQRVPFVREAGLNPAAAVASRDAGASSPG